MANYIYRSTVTDVFGLTGRMVRQMGEPDGYVTNPHCPSWSPARIYRLERVEQFAGEHREEIEDRAITRAERWKKCPWLVCETIEWAASVPVLVFGPHRYADTNYTELLKTLKKRPGASLSYWVLRDRLARALGGVI